ncbi:MAG: hypothetical protein ACTSPW_20580 [Promethearchaeota archaeon]
MNSLKFTASGIRGIFGSDLTPEVVFKLAIAFGLYIKKQTVLIGRDTRTSGEILEKSVIRGLVNSGCKVITLGICPTPVIIFQKNKMNIPAAIIISGSHNPPEWNALKLITETFLSTEEINEVYELYKRIDIKEYSKDNIDENNIIYKNNSIEEYITELYKYIDFKNIKNKNNLRVAIDTGAGAGKLVTPRVLQDLGCDLRIINNDFIEDGRFPRGIEPIRENLKDLITVIWKEKLDIGFAHDCDADRVTIVGDDYKCYSEDISLAIIMDYYLETFSNDNKKCIFITNLASSLMFDVLAERYGAKIIRTPIGERYLVEKMNQLIEKSRIKGEKDTIIMGGEGSCGGVIFPLFNAARDGIFAAAKIIEILVEKECKISELVKKLPKFYSFREKIEIKDSKIGDIIRSLKEELISIGENVEQIGLDLKFGEEKKWFVLIHPSNTEPIIRVISEANREALAKLNCESTAELVKMVISDLK